MTTTYDEFVNDGSYTFTTDELRSIATAVQHVQEAANRLSGDLDLAMDIPVYLTEDHRDENVVGWITNQHGDYAFTPALAAEKIKKGK